MIPVATFLPHVHKEHRYLVMAIAYYGNTPYVGWNSNKTAPRFKRRFQDSNVLYTRHAEQHAISKLPHDTNYRRVKVYVTRFMANGKQGMARPCEACMATLTEIGVNPKNIFYTNWEGSWERLK